MNNPFRSFNLKAKRPKIELLIISDPHHVQFQLIIMSDDIIEELRCPITGEIFWKPVVASDGHTYEKCAIEKWLKDKNTSPMTKEKIDKKLTINWLVKKLVEKISCEDKHPKNCLRCAGIDERYLDIKNWDEDMFKKFSENQLKIIIDNMDLESTNNKGSKLIHFICRYSTFDIIKYVVSKGGNLEHANNEGCRPFHFLCGDSAPEIIEYVIDKGVNLESAANNGWKLIHFICRESTPNVIKYMIDKKVNLESATDNGWKPVHILCRYSTLEMIEYIINKGVNLNDRTKKMGSKCEGYLPIDLVKLNKKLSESEKIELTRMLSL